MNCDACGEPMTATLRWFIGMFFQRLVPHYRCTNEECVRYIKPEKPKEKK